MTTLADLRTGFVGQRGRLFWLALRTSVLTVLTLGLYRFWMKTRLRRYYWSSIRPGGKPLEYVGEPLEKLLGFLIAVVFLAFYIGIVNLILMFFSFALLQGNFAAYALSFIGIIPVVFYAQYRARRYILARTRWRGIRFGMQPGAWGYAGRALWHWFITLTSLGLFWPRMTYRLEKYRTDRTTYGTRAITQGGSWGMLYPPYLLAYVSGLVSVGALAAVLWLERPDFAAVLGLSVPLLMIGAVHYRVAAFRKLTNTKTAEGVGFVAKPRTPRVFGIYLLGSLLAGLILLGFLFVLLFAVGISLGETAVLTLDPTAMPQLGAPSGLLLVLGLVMYFAVFILWGVLRHVFLTMPLLRHYSQTLTITGVPGLLSIRQTDRDRFAEAEGFAEALDIGAAI